MIPDLVFALTSRSFWSISCRAPSLIVAVTFNSLIQQRAARQQ